MLWKHVYLFDLIAMSVESLAMNCFTSLFTHVTETTAFIYLESFELTLFSESSVFFFSVFVIHHLVAKFI